MHQSTPMLFHVCTTFQSHTALCSHSHTALYQLHDSLIWNSTQIHAAWNLYTTSRSQNHIHVLLTHCIILCHIQHYTNSHTLHHSILTHCLLLLHGAAHPCPVCQQVWHQHPAPLATAQQLEHHAYMHNAMVSHQSYFWHSDLHSSLAKSVQFQCCQTGMLDAKQFVDANLEM